MLLKWKILEELALCFRSENAFSGVKLYFSVCLRDLKLDGGLLRFKVILEIEM